MVKRKYLRGYTSGKSIFSAFNNGDELGDTTCSDGLT